ncbi:MAG: hypothetical protein ABEJ07_04860, partial [Candidatus Nanohaloarchaea archaeon]
NDGGNIMLQNNYADGGAWMALGFTRDELGKIERQTEEANLYIEVHGAQDWEDFLRNPDTQRGMKYPDSMCLASHIYHEAHPDGQLPEFEGATLHVHPDRIEYQLAT